MAKMMAKQRYYGPFLKVYSQIREQIKLNNPGKFPEDICSSYFRDCQKLP